MLGLVLSGLVSVALAGDAVDTVLTRVWNLGYPVNTVFNGAGGEVFVTGARGLERLTEEGAFVVEDPQQTTPVFWTGDSLVSGYTWEQLYGSSPYTGSERWKRFFARNSGLFTEARWGATALLVCDGNRLFELQANPSKGRYLPGKSVRGFTWVGDRLVANTYSGVFVDELPIPGIEFNDGGVVSVGEWTYSTGMFVVRWANDSLQGPAGEGQTSGTLITQDSLEMFRRDGVAWQDELWWYSHDRFGVFRDGVWQVLTTEIDVDHAVGIGDRLVLMTRNGEVWAFDGRRFDRLDLPDGIHYVDAEITDEGTWLFATNHGLALWDERGGDLKFLGVDQGIPSSSVCAIQRDRWGTFWVSTFAGVVRYCSKYGLLEHHEPLVEFNRYSEGITPEGDLAFGSTSGIYSFTPTAPSLPGGGAGRRGLMTGIVVFSALLITGIGFSMHRKLQAERLRSTAQAEELERQALLAQIREGIYRDLQAVTVDSLADAVGMSRRSFYRRCSDLGIRPSVLIREVRLRVARTLMEKQEMAFNEVASKVGYSPNHLRRLLAEETSAP